MSKGYIFDFNGTMFWDTEYHDEAWMAFSDKYGLNITKKYLREELHGKVNREILKIVYDPAISEAEATLLSEEKELIYRQIVHRLGHKIQLAPGVQKVLNKLKKKKTPMAIATSSPKVNVDFYKVFFNLTKWFPENLIIYDDGSFSGKPAPDIFLLAAERLNLDPSDCIVVEDSITGIKSARAAGVGHIYLVSSGNHLAWDRSDTFVEVIEDFNHFIT
jgi:HAD superfamily hydrolase (TIGR01509 family)